MYVQHESTNLYVHSICTYISISTICMSNMNLIIYICLRVYVCKLLCFRVYVSKLLCLESMLVSCFVFEFMLVSCFALEFMSVIYFPIYSKKYINKN